MNKTVRIIVIILFSIVLLVSGGMVIYRSLQYKEGSDIYDEADKLVDLPNFSEFENNEEEVNQEDFDSEYNYYGGYWEEMANMDFSALQEVNSDVQGWIVIPGTNVSYPLMYPMEEESTFYLNHAWNKASSLVGAIYIDQGCSPSMGGFNTVIYGHNMNNGSMFGSLKNYRNSGWWSGHRYIYITTNAGSFCYEIFAAYEVSTTGTTYQIGFPNDNSRQEFIDFCVKQSVYDTGVVPTTNDSIVTLSTCTGMGHATRWVIQGVMRGAVQPDEPETDPVESDEELPETEDAVLPDSEDEINDEIDTVEVVEVEQ